MRRATTLLTYLDSNAAATDLVDLTRKGVVRAMAIELPPEAEAIRDEVRAFVESIKDLPFAEQRTRMIETGYVMRSEEHTSELQSLMRISYAVFCLKKNK